MHKPNFFKIQHHKDDRGGLYFCNEFDLSTFQRFYIISPAHKSQIRAWQAHKMELKAFLPIAGRIKVVMLPVINFENYQVGTPLVKILDVDAPEIIFLPGGYANGFQFLTSNSKLMVFSNFSLEDSKRDDYRFDYKKFYDWEKSGC